MHLPSRLRLDGWSEYKSITWDIQIRDMDKAITSKKKIKYMRKIWIPKFSKFMVKMPVFLGGANELNRFSEKFPGSRNEASFVLCPFCIPFLI